MKKRTIKIWKRFKKFMPTVEVSIGGKRIIPADSPFQLSGRPTSLPKPKKGKQAYDPSAVDKYLKRLPIIGDKRLGQTEEWKQEDYPKKLEELRPDEVLFLRRPNLNVPLWVNKKSKLEDMGIKFRQHKVAQGRMFTLGGKRKLVEASQILEKNIKNKKKTAVTCNYGQKRSTGVFYLVHRRMGASHEEALYHSILPDATMEVLTPDEARQLKRLYETRHLYESK